MTAAIILNYNNWEDTLNCIESVERWNTAPLKYIVVDNGSTRPGTVDQLHDALTRLFHADYLRLSDSDPLPSTLPRATFLVSPTNDGYAQGNNKGLRLAYEDSDLDYILILNNDTLFVEDIVGPLVEAYQRLPHPALVSPLLFKRNMEGIDYNCARLSTSVGRMAYHYLFYYTDPFGIQRRWQKERQLLRSHPDFLEKEAVEIDVPSGSCMLIRKDLFKQIGGFDPHTFLYSEEPILYKRILPLQLQNFLIPSLKLIHLGACSTDNAPSLFIIKAGIQSARYYVNHYTNANALARALFYLVSAAFIPKFRLQKWVFRVFRIKGKKERTKSEIEHR